MLKTSFLLKIILLTTTTSDNTRTHPRYITNQGEFEQVIENLNKPIKQLYKSFGLFKEVIQELKKLLDFVSQNLSLLGGFDYSLVLILDVDREQKVKVILVSPREQSVTGGEDRRTVFEALQYLIESMEAYKPEKGPKKSYNLRSGNNK